MIENGTIAGVSNRTGINDAARTMAGAKISDTNERRLRFCNLTTPKRWLDWLRFGLSMRAD